MDSITCWKLFSLMIDREEMTTAKTGIGTDHVRVLDIDLNDSK